MEIYVTGINGGCKGDAGGAMRNFAVKTISAFPPPLQNGIKSKTALEMELVPH
jgi:hypothetical protein